jgi:hypothetical protein
MVILLNGQALPEIVTIVLRQLAERHAKRDLTDAEFTTKLNRIAREELQPRRLRLLVRELEDHTTRFLIKDDPGDRVRYLLDCPLSGRDEGENEAATMFREDPDNHQPGKRKRTAAVAAGPV